MSPIFIRGRALRDGSESLARSKRSRRWRCAYAGVLALCAVISVAMCGAQQQAQPSGQQTGNGSQPGNSSAQTTDPGPSRPAAGATPLATPSPPNAGLNPEALNAERKRQISADSAQLLKLAVELKAEVDKTTKDTLSLDVIRKADQIEKLAHSVKEKMRLEAGPG